MLVLTRKEGESIFINGQEIILTVVRIDRGRVRLGIKAPPEISIERDDAEPKSPTPQPAVA